jgi:hypothetical protein
VNTTSSFNRRSWLPLLAAGWIGLLLMGCVPEYHQQVKTVSGFKSSMRLPRPALLNPEPQPDCGYKEGEVGNRERAAEKAPAPADVATSEPQRTSVGDGSPPVSGAASQPRLDSQNEPSASLAQRVRLEYERNCFQRAEMRVRERLLQLQAWVGHTMRGVRRRESDTPAF